MAQTTIEWTSQHLPDGRIVPGYTLNAWSGCTKVILPSGQPDPQCVFCYAEREEDKRRGRSKWGKGNPRTMFKSWRDNLRKWDALARKEGVYPFVFAHPLSDWADHEAQVPDAWRDEEFALVEKYDHLTYLFLTKRVDYAAEYLSRRYPNGIPDHIWFGYSAGNREALQYRSRDAQHVKASHIFVSAEPLVENIADDLDALLLSGMRLDWFLTGGETGSFEQIAPRIAHSQWYRDAFGVVHRHRKPKHFKQWGNLAPIDQSECGVIPAQGAVVTRLGERAHLTSGTMPAFLDGLVLAGEPAELHGFLGGSQGKHAHGRRLYGEEYHEHPEVRVD